jgi:hypothetical protein
MCTCISPQLTYPIFVDDLSSSKQHNGELSQTEGAESASLEEESSRTDGCVETSKEEHPNVTVVIDGPDDGAARDPSPQQLTNHNHSEKPSHSPANQIGSNSDQDVTNVSEHHWICCEFKWGARGFPTPKID